MNQPDPFPRDLLADQGFVTRFVDRVADAADVGQTLVVFEHASEFRVGLQRARLEQLVGWVSFINPASWAHEALGR